MIPDGWTELPLKAVIKLASGDSRPKDLLPAPQGEHTSPVYGGNGILGYSSVHNSTGEDIIIGRVGEYCGVTRLVKGRKWITDNALFAKSVEPDFCRAYLVLRLKHFDLSKLRSKGGQPLVSQEPIYAQRFAFPPRPEQEAIVSIISKWDRAIETVEALIANTRAQKKVLMQSVLTGDHRLAEFSGEWKAYRLDELELRGWLKLGRGRVISKKDIDNATGSYPIYSSSVKNGGLFGAYGKFDFDCELITWSVDGGGDFFHRPQHKFSITNVSGWMKLDESRLIYRFVAAQLQAQHAKLQFDYLLKAHPSVIRTMYHIAVPDLEEQKAIAEMIDLIDRELSNLNIQLSALRKEKSALMQQLLTGKRRLKVLEDGNA